MSRKLALALLATVGSVAVAQTTVYETKGPDGPSFSDHASPGAVVVDVPPPNAVVQPPPVPPAGAYQWRTAPGAPAGTQTAGPSAAPPQAAPSPAGDAGDANDWTPAYGAYPPYAHPAAAAAAWDRALRYGQPPVGGDPRAYHPAPAPGAWAPPPAAVEHPRGYERGRR